MEYSRDVLDYNERNVYIRYILIKLSNFYFIKMSCIAREISEIYKISFTPNHIRDFLAARRNLSEDRLDIIESYLMDKYFLLVDEILEGLDPNDQSLKKISHEILQLNEVPTRFTPKVYLNHKLNN